MTGVWLFSAYMAVAFVTLGLVRLFFGRWIDWVDVATAVLFAVLWPLSFVMAGLMLVSRVLFSLAACEEDDDE
jgi:hypothetical protein